MKTTEGEGVGGRSLARNISKLEGHARALGWGLARLTSKSIIHTELHKPNDKLVDAQLEHLWCTDEPRANTNSQNSPQPGLGGSHHLPPYSILYAWPRDQHPNVILSQDSPNGNLEIPKIGLLMILEAHSFVRKHLIHVRSEKKL